MIAKRIALTAVAALVASAPAVGQNLVLNGSFETPDSPPFVAAIWDNFNNTFAENPVLQDMEGSFFELPQDGLRSVKTFGQFAGPGIESNAGFFQQISVTENTMYDFSVWTLALSSDPIVEFIPEGGPGGLNFGHLPLLIIDFKDAGGTIIGSAELTAYDFNTNPVDEWVQYSSSATAPAGAVSAQVTGLFLQFGTPPGSLFWDNVSVTAEGTSTCPPEADFNGDTFVDVVDVLDLLDAIDQCQGGM